MKMRAAQPLFPDGVREPLTASGLCQFNGRFEGEAVEVANGNRFGFSMGLRASGSRSATCRVFLGNQRIFLQLRC